MKNLILILIMTLMGCCPIVSGLPGDASSTNWKQPSENQTEPTTIDCQGKERDRLDIRKSNVTVKNCTINGDVRIWGPAKNANAAILLEKSRQPNYVTWLRNKAPTNVTIEDTTIKGIKTIPLYVGPGVTFTTIKNVKITGKSASTMVYLGAESYHTTIKDSEINGTFGSREAIAIDASNGNVIVNNIIKYEPGMLYYGGIFLYRNCGEGGVIRHTTPSNNLIKNNTFVGDGIAVYLSSRDGGLRCYCQEDRGYPLGSSQSDLDHARGNYVVDNDLGDGVIKQGKSSSSNIIE